MWSPSAPTDGVPGCVAVRYRQPPASWSGWNHGGVQHKRSSDRPLRVVFLGVFSYGVLVHTVYLIVGRTFQELPVWAAGFANSLIVLDATALLLLALRPRWGWWVAAAVLLADAAFNIWVNFVHSPGVVIAQLGTVVISGLAALCVWCAARATTNGQH